MAELSRRYVYDPGTGIFTNRPETGHRYSGRRAGWKTSRGYIALKANKKTYQAHRVAWFFVYGEWPAVDIDHINGDRTDNRISNLRLATRQQNMWNKKRHHSKKGDLPKGVYARPNSRRFRAIITIDGKSKKLGDFSSPEEAHAMYAQMAKNHFGDRARLE